MAKEKGTAATENKTRHEYTKAQLAAAKRYEHDVDLINALLDVGKKYTTDDVDSIINNFKKGKVR